MKLRKHKEPLNLPARRTICKSGRPASGSARKTLEQQPGFYSQFIGRERRREIIAAYGSMIGRNPHSTLMSESHLPFPKELIRQSIFEELSENPDSVMRDQLEIAYAQLECFLPPEQYELVSEFKLASRLAEEVCVSGSPQDILKSVELLRAVKGDDAVEIQESVSVEIQKRLLQIRSVGTFLIAQ